MEEKIKVSYEQIKKANDEVKSMKPGHFVAMAALEVK